MKGNYFGISWETDVVQGDQVIAGLIGYLVSQEHLVREPITNRINLIELNKASPKVIHIWFTERKKPTVVGEMLFQSIIARAWGSPIGNGSERNVVFHQEKSNDTKDDAPNNLDVA